MPAAAPPVLVNVTALATALAVVAVVAVAAFPPIDKPLAVPVNPVPAPLKLVAVNTPVFGTKDSLVEDTVAGLLPVEFAEMTGYQVADDDVLSVIAILVAFVAVVAVLADPADPSMLTPVRLWLALARFKAICVVPIYRLELPNTALGIVPDSCPAGRLVRLAPDPLKTVAVKVPVLGLYWSFVELVNSVLRLPVV